MDIVHIKFGDAKVDERPLPKGTFGADMWLPQPVDGLPEHEIDMDDERDKKLARTITLWTIGGVIGYGLAYLAHGVWG